MKRLIQQCLQYFGYELRKLNAQSCHRAKQTFGPLIDHDSILDIFQFSSSSEASQEIKKKFLHKLETGEYQLNSFSCPICQANTFTDVASSPQGFKWGICVRCGLLQNYHRLNHNDLNTFYESGEYQTICMGDLNDALHFDIEYKINSLCFTDIFEKLRLSLENKRILEIGCGSGGILLALKERGAEVFGYDIDSHRIEQGKKHLPQLQVGDAMSTDCELPEDLDYVVLSNILEHLFSPHIFLNQLRSKLEQTSPQSRIIIDVPNLETAFIYSNETFLKFLHIAHIWYFNAITLERLLNHCCFEVEHIFSRDSSFSVIAKMSAKPIENQNNAYWNSISSINFANYALDPNNLRNKVKVEFSKLL